MELDRVVLGIDFGAPSLAAARWVAEELAPDARLLLVHVLDLPRPPAFLGEVPPISDALLDSEHDAAAARLEEARASLGERDPATEMRTGRAAPELAAAAREFGADLVVVSTRDGSSGPPRFLGSTAEQLIRQAECPVLLAGSPLRRTPRRILAPVDGSLTGRRILEWARFLSGRFDAHVTALFVLDPRVFGRVRGVSASNDQGTALKQALEKSRRWLEGELRSAGFEKGDATVLVALGRPGAEILAAQAVEASDLIVIGSRGAGAMERALLGSVAHEVLNALPCPVLMVSGPTAGLLARTG